MKKKNDAKEHILSLENEVEVLKKKLEELGFSKQEFEEANHELAASNQQLAATEQQLRATNQQLKATEQQLRASNRQLASNKEQLDLVLKGSNDAPWDWDLETNNLYYSPRWWEQIGYRIDELANDSELWQRLMHPDDYDRVNSFFAGVLESDTEKYEVEFRLQHKNKQYVPVLSRGFIQRDNNGKAIRVSGTNMDLTEKKKAEDALKESEEKLRNIIENATNVFYSHTADHIITYISPQIEKVLGYTPEEALKKWTDFATDNPINEDGYNSTVEAIKTGIAQEPYELELRRKDGEIIFIEVHESPVIINGKVVGIAGSLTEITNRKAAQQALMESEEKFRLAMEASRDGIFDWNLIDNSIYYSPAWKSMLGYAYDELPDDFSIWENLTEPEDAERSWKMQQELINKKIDRFEMEFKMKHKDGHWVDILSRAKAIFNEEGKAIRIVGTHFDISERKEAEMKIAKSEHRFRSVLENIDLIGIMLDMEGKIIFANDYFLSLTGWKREEVINKDWVGMFIPSDISEEVKKVFLLSSKESKIVKHYTNDIVTKNGDRLTINWSNTSHPDEHNVITATTSIGSDITDQLLNKKELIKAKEKAEESDRLKSAFLANMSHEIRTPMNGIMGFTNLLNKPDLSGEKQKEFIEIIQKSGQRMLNTVNNIVEMSRLETGQIEPEYTLVDLNEKCEYMLEFFKPEAEAKNIELNRLCKGEQCYTNFRTDSYMFESILINLIKNAIKYTNEGRIDFGCQEGEWVKDGELGFYVADTGIGIPKEKQDLIFDRFIRADIDDKNIYEGSGLGLSIAKSYVDLLGGRIWVESVEGVGSTFRFVLPN